MSNKLPNIKERILYILESKGIVKDKFFTKIGMTYGNFTGKAKESPLNSNAIGNILLELPDVNAEWLINGNGSIWKNNEINILADHPPNYGCDAYKDKYISRLESENELLRAENERKQEMIDGFMTGSIVIEKKEAS